MSELDRAAVLIALARAKQFTSERAWAIRSEPDDRIRRLLFEWRVDASVFVAAGMPALKLKLGRRRPTDEFIQEQVDLHLVLLGLEPVPVQYVHPHLAERMDLAEEWERHLTESAPWAHHVAHPRTARLLTKADDPVWQPLLRLIERGIHPVGLHREQEHFLVLDTHVDHRETLRRRWEEAIATDSEQEIPELG